MVPTQSGMKMVKPSDAGECQSLSRSSRCCKLSPRISILATRPVEYHVFFRLEQLCRITQLLQRCRKQTRKLYTFCVVNCCARNNNLQSPDGQLKTQRGNLLIPNFAKDAKKDAKDVVWDSTNEQDEPRDSSIATRRSEKAGGKGFKSEYCVKNNCKILFQF